MAYQHQSSPSQSSSSSSSTSFSSTSSTAYSSTSSSSSLKMSTSPVHAASLVSPEHHSPALLDLVQVKMSRPLIEYVVDCVMDAVDYAMSRPTSPTRRRSSSFVTFVNNVITRAEVTTPTVLVALAYIDRAKPHLHIALEEWALERVFLGALIVASKYLNDSTLKNVHWALCTGVFGKRDVGRIEREFLDVLDFELGVNEDVLLVHHDGLSSLIVPSPSSSRLSTPPTSPRSVLSRTVPELLPSSSSPASSLGSSSPRTPENSGSPMEIEVESKSTTTTPPHPHETQVKPRKRTASNCLGDLIRSFPVPTSSSSSSRNHHRSRGRPLQISA